jgi:hypothetical protein
MQSRRLAVSLVKLNLQLGCGIPTRPFLQAFLLDPSEGWQIQRLDLHYPGSRNPADQGEFIVGAVGDVNGDGHSEFVCAVTIDSANCHVLAYSRDDGTWNAQPVIEGGPSFHFVRSIAVGDLNADGVDEIVIGTRPSGAVIVLDGKATGYRATTIDRDQYGAGTTNTREIVVADLDSDGVLEIIAATARTGSGKWDATPGAIFLYRRSVDGWEKILIEDHRARTHTRMIGVADLKDDGVKRIVSSAVGVLEPQSGRVNPEPELRMYTVTGRHAMCEPIDTLENMIKSRSFAAGDIDGNGRTALVVGTRALGIVGLETGCLYIYRFDHQAQAWGRETLDTSGPLGFHCVAVTDVDDDGQLEIVASDDGRGLIKLYKRLGSGWKRETIYDAKGAIFCSSIHLIEF